MWGATLILAFSVLVLGASHEVVSKDFIDYIHGFS